jgi:hypothetical protein
MYFNWNFWRLANVNILFVFTIETFKEAKICDFKKHLIKILKWSLRVFSSNFIATKTATAIYFKFKLHR